MKTFIKKLLVFQVLVGLGWSGELSAQTFKVLHTFTNIPYEGGLPQGRLVLSGNTLYSTANWGGISNYGTVFAINTDGSGFTVLHSFSGGSEGAGPSGDLLLSGNTLYGTTAGGGSSSNGTVFALNTDGSGFKTLHEFSPTSATSPYTNSDGAHPINGSGLTLSGSLLYGTAFEGGSSGYGTVFSVNTDGTGFTVLHDFSTLDGNNLDGANPVSRLIVSGNTLYGTAGRAGVSGGTVFALNTDGSGFMTLEGFSASTANMPSGGLVLSGNTLYGTTVFGGSVASGTVFSINTDGTGFAVLHDFPTTGGANVDGANPMSGLILSGNTLYGTANAGGTFNGGTVFAVNTDGTGFTNLHSFNPGSDGARPVSELVLVGNVLYGTASQPGTVFSLSLPINQPQLTITSTGSNIVLTWPTNFTGFILQSTTNPPLWIANLPAPTVVNGQNVVTNPISSSQQFFRLSQ